MNPYRLVFLSIVVIVPAMIIAGQAPDLNARLRQAAQDGDLATVKELLARGADVNAKDKDDQTAVLWVAPARDNPEMAKFLIAQGADVNAKDKHGNTALMIAASQSNPGIMTVLIEAGAAVNAQNNEGRTALMAAAFRANLDEIKILLAANPHPMLQDKKGRFAYDVASEGSKNYTDDENRKRFAEALKLLARPVN